MRLLAVLAFVALGCGEADSRSNRPKGALHFEIAEERQGEFVPGLTGCIEVEPGARIIGSGNGDQMGVNPSDDGTPGLRLVHSPNKAGDVLTVQVFDDDVLLEEKKYTFDFVNSGRVDTFEVATAAAQYRLRYWGSEDCKSTS